jgi:hypothetical protein
MRNLEIRARQHVTVAFKEKYYREGTSLIQIGAKSEGTAKITIEIAADDMEKHRRDVTIKRISEQFELLVHTVVSSLEME